MKRALMLAKKRMGFASPNPCVGAVIVKGGRVIAEGWHKKAGEEHAEIMAINVMMKKSGIKTMDLDPMLFQNAELYVTLEPCCHQGKTPACEDSVCAAGFKKVYIGMKDPFKKVNGKSIKMLKKKGVDVEVFKKDSDLGREIRKINQPFIKWAQTGLPYVTMKAGMSLDGKIATCEGESKWITCEKSRKDARIERSLCDAVLVGAGTVIADDCELAAHGKFKNKKLLRVILDPKLKLPLDSNIFRDENVLLICTDAASERNLEKFKKAGVFVKKFNKISVGQIFRFLGKRDVQSVFVEGGAFVHGSIYDAFLKDKKMLDRVLFYVAPKIFGGVDSLSVIGGGGVEKLSKIKNLENLEFERFEDDLKVSGVFSKY